MRGMRSWISATSSLASVVMIAKVRSHSPDAGSFQFSQTPARPNGCRPSSQRHKAASPSAVCTENLIVFHTPAEVQTANVALQVVQRYERRLGSVAALRDAEVQQKITEEVSELTAPLQAALEGVVEAPDISRVVKVVTQTVAERTISIPKIVVLPKKQITFHFDDFDLMDLASVNHRPISDELLVENLRTGARIFLARATSGQLEMRPEDYIVRHLIERNEIDYDAHAELLYKLSGQIVQRVRSYVPTDRDVENVLLSHGPQLADFVFAQMMQHYRETAQVLRPVGGLFPSGTFRAKTSTISKLRFTGGAPTSSCDCFLVTATYVVRNGVRSSQHDRRVSNRFPFEALADRVDSAVGQPARRACRRH
jgi:hypothetical protein